MSSSHKLTQYKLIQSEEQQSCDSSRSTTRKRPLFPPLLEYPLNLFLAMAILLLISLGVNIFLILQHQRVSVPTEGLELSPFAGLTRNISVPLKHDTDFTQENLSAVADLWQKFNGDTGVVALSKVFAHEKKLPSALPFPWDDEKAVYLIQGYHDLHCLRTLFRYVMYTERGLPQQIALSHALHCLDQLRQEVICNADDTPRYAGNQNPPGTGSGQVRMCKDWAKLEKWALDNTACFKHEDEIPGPMIDRFKSCPDGRILWPVDPVATDP